MSVTIKIIVPGEPIVKPRMSRRDSFIVRPCVGRYREYQNRIYKAIVENRLHLRKPRVPVALSIDFFVSSPRGMDLSNLVKSAEEGLHPVLLDDDTIDHIKRYDRCEARRCIPRDARTEITIVEIDGCSR